ncbi:uncharacterized protein LOC130891492 [Diorhabda carinulata]|uniref:uncharacterized protein LOC130891492 n=1 Tax=Diorhabda carinulata TaxID=1163345 RepID=UPI0025A266A5|nr:uncharacterized protein LOC130891492 [Diorhabda carinulata]
MKPIIILAVMLRFSKNVLCEEDFLEEAVAFVRACGTEDLTLCIKERALRYIDNLPNNLDFGSGLKIKSVHPERIVRRAPITSLPDELRAREEVLDNLLLERIKDFIKSHTFEFKVPDEAIIDLDKSVEEGRKKKGGGGLRIRPIIMMLILKAAVVGAIILKFIGLVAFKALLLAKIAFTISTIVALKKLVETKHHTSTYEVVAAHPHYDDHSHFDRSFNNDLPYKGYKGGRNVK